MSLVDGEVSRRAAVRLGIGGGALLFLTACGVNRLAPSTPTNMPNSEARAELDKMLAGWDMKNPLWYLKTVPEIRSFQTRFPSSSDNRGVYNLLDEFFEKKLETDELTVAKTGPDYDKTRIGKAIDKIVIHHSAGPEDVSARRFSVWGLQNIYAPDYFDNQKKYDKSKEDEDRDFFGFDITGQPIWSNHFIEMKRLRSGVYVVEPEMTFSSYHWKIDNGTGEVTRLLKDDHLGFHAAGSNTQSYGVVVNGNFTDRKPSEKVLDGFADLYKTHYRDQVPIGNIVGHRETPNAKTICPGELFLGESGWKKELLKRLT